MIQAATIITRDHIDKALALFNSLRRFRQVILHVLVVDASVDELRECNFDKNFKLYNGPTINKRSSGRELGEILDRYAVKEGGRSADSRRVQTQTGLKLHNLDPLRWALKPAFMQYLLRLNKVLLYLDCDLYFYNDFQFLVEQLDGQAIMLSPHWRTIEPISPNGPIDEYKFNFLHGLYNAGFVGVTKQATEILSWWHRMCLNACTVDHDRGLFVDQRYLDIVPLYFGNAGVVINQHKGCNVAAWNRTRLLREKHKGEVLVAGDPIIFIHFSQITLADIEAGTDELLGGYYTMYMTELDTIRSDLVSGGLGRFVSRRSKVIV